MNSRPMILGVAAVALSIGFAIGSWAFRLWGPR